MLAGCTLPNSRADLKKTWLTLEYVHIVSSIVTPSAIRSAGSDVATRPAHSPSQYCRRRRRRQGASTEDSKGLECSMDHGHVLGMVYGHARSDILHACVFSKQVGLSSVGLQTICMLLGFRPLPPAPLSSQAGEAPLWPSQKLSHWHASGRAKRMRHFATERGRSKRVGPNFHNSNP